MLMAPLARAGSIAALAVLLILALVPAWNGPWSALRHAAGGPELGGVRAGPDLTPMDALSASVTADPPAADLGQSITFTCTASGGTSPTCTHGPWVTARSGQARRSRTPTDLPGRTRPPAP